MERGKKKFRWSYLVQAEGTTCEYTRAAGACKTFVWLGVSILLGMGVAQLT